MRRAAPAAPAAQDRPAGPQPLGPPRAVLEPQRPPKPLRKASPRPQPRPQTRLDVPPGAIPRGKSGVESGPGARATHAPRCADAAGGGRAAAPRGGVYLSPLPQGLGLSNPRAIIASVCVCVCVSSCTSDFVCVCVCGWVEAPNRAINGWELMRFEEHVCLHCNHHSMRTLRQTDRRLGLLCTS